MEPVTGFISVAGGPVRGVALPDLLIRVLFHTLVVFIILTAYCISMLFLYRNCQTSGSSRLEAVCFGLLEPNFWRK
ncbi:hypothetical protein Ddc_14815 [Ditylenchus destructor]|nr:hypothetical protein Ddc_14815 [Ditylenchus destructor]